MASTIVLEFGALSPRLAEQDIALRLSISDLERFQELADAITKLKFGKCLSNGEADKARDRLSKIIFRKAGLGK